MRFRPFVKRRNGVSTIVRDTYRTSEANGSWWELVRQVMKRDGNKCGRCSYVGPDVERHHIIKLSDGGRNVLSNIITLCHKCHAKRHSHMFTRIL